MTKRRASSAPAVLAALLAVLLPAGLAGCLFDKPEDKVELKLSKVPDGADQIKVTAVSASDTSKVLAAVYQGAHKPGATLRFSLGKATGKDWMLKVEGYQKGYLVYKALVPSGEGGNTEAEIIPVRQGLPGVVIDSIKRDGDSITFHTSFRNTPDTLHWHLNIGADSLGGNNYIISYEPSKTVEAIRFDPGSLISFDLHEPETHRLFPVQEPDTMLANEALGTAKSSVKITEAYTEGDSVHILLSLANFRLPLVDEPTPGQGFPYVLDKATYRRLTDFKPRKTGDITRLVGPTWALNGVKDILVALHYADDMRIRPLAADSVSSEIALRTVEKVPTVDIVSYSIAGDVLNLVLKLENADGYHTHVYGDRVTWPTNGPYQICYETTCEVGPTIWKNAKKLFVSVQQDVSHNLLRPLVVDSLVLPADP